jgi:hypothetical protein
LIDGINNIQALIHFCEGVKATLVLVAALSWGAAAAKAARPERAITPKYFILTVGGLFREGWLLRLINDNKSTRGN